MIYGVSSICVSETIQLRESKISWAVAILDQKLAHFCASE